MKVILIHNKGYKWHNKGDLYFKGYIVDRETNNVYRDESAINLLQGIDSEKSLILFLEKVEGCFAIIINNVAFKAIAVDRARSMPLFYSENADVVSDSAEEVRNYLKIPKDGVDEDNYLALYAKTFIFGNSTVYSIIKQLDLGCIAYYKEDCFKVERYYYHYSGNIFDDDESVLIKKLEKVSDNAFERIKRIVGDRPVVLSMSGGYDSRYIACMLKRAGIEDVLCYTYGKRDSFEVKQSKKNAEALGYRWTCIEYSDEIINRTLDEIGKQYIDSYDFHDYTAYLQNFPAVRALDEKGWFKPNSIFMTGLCGDMPSGYYIPSFDQTIHYDNDYAANWLYESIYVRQLPDDVFKIKWIEQIKAELVSLKIKVHDYQSFVSALDAILTTTSHSHCFLHMNRTHEFFGYEWLIPFWDSELLTTWYSVPAELRYKQHLYENFLLDHVCSKYGIGQKKTVVGYSKNKAKRRLQYFAGGIINWILLHIGIPFKRKYDFNNWAPLELLLYKNLLSRKTVRYHKAGLVNLLTQYTLQRRYGVKNMIKAQKRIIS